MVTKMASTKKPKTVRSVVCERVADRIPKQNKTNCNSKVELCRRNRNDALKNLFPLKFFWKPFSSPVPARGLRRAHSKGGAKWEEAKAKTF